MQREETKQLMSILQISYPSHYWNMSVEEKKQTLGLYFEMFGHYPIELVAAILKNYIGVNQYPPTIAGLRERVRMLLNKETHAESYGTRLRRP